MRVLLAAIFLVLSSSVWANGDSQAPVQKRGQQYDEQPPKASNEKAAKHDGVSKALPALVAQMISKPENEKSEPNRAAEHKWYDTFLNHPTEWLLALFNGLLVLYTYRLWIATRDLVEGAENTAKRQLRAYVWIDKTQPSPNIDAVPFIVATEIRNTGSTPAHDVRCFTELLPFDHPLPVGFTFKQPPQEIPGPHYVVNPGSTHFVRTSPDEVFTDDIKTAIRNGTKRLYFWGVVRYRDAFKQERWSKFRFYWDRGPLAPGGWTYCDEGNEADED